MSTDTPAPAKSNRNRNIVIGVVVLLFVCGGLYAMMPKGTTTTAPKAADTGAQQAAPVAQAPAATEAPTVNPNAPHAIGEAVDIGNGATFTVESAAPDTDGNLVVVGVVDNSAGTDKIAVSSIMSFDVKDSNGNKGQIALVIGLDTAQMDGEVLPGDKLRGHVAYQPGLGTGLKLYFKPDLMADPIAFDLGQ